MSRIYLVQSAGSLDGADGYSYGLLHGGQPWLLISFVDYMGSPRQTIHKKDSLVGINRRPISGRGRDLLDKQEAPS